MIPELENLPVEERARNIQQRVNLILNPIFLAEDAITAVLCTGLELLELELAKARAMDIVLNGMLDLWKEIERC